MRRVLIVDDEVLVRIGIKHSIAWEQNGFELIGEASDGKEALEMIQKLAPDIVILDINMPVLNGIEVLRELKEQKYKGKVIVLTCFNEIEYARSAMKYGASDYVLKTTLNTDELLNALLDLEFDDKGALYLEKGNIIRQESFHVPVVDTTAAGDTFTGYFFGSILSGMKPETALQRAAKAAAIAVTKKGAAPSIPEALEVDGFFSE